MARERTYTISQNSTKMCLAARSVADETRLWLFIPEMAKGVLFVDPPPIGREENNCACGQDVIPQPYVVIATELPCLIHLLFELSSAFELQQSSANPASFGHFTA